MQIKDGQLKQQSSKIVNYSKKFEEMLTKFKEIENQKNQPASEPSALEGYKKQEIALMKEKDLSKFYRVTLSKVYDGIGSVSLEQISQKMERNMKALLELRYQKDLLDV